MSAAGSTGLAITRYQWDLDGDGLFETDTGAQAVTSRAYSAAADINVGVRVTNQLDQATVAHSPLRIRSLPPPGVTGVSVNNGAIATNDPAVELSLVWPAYAETALVSNDGGFAPSVSGAFPVAARIPWQLQSSGREQLPKVVYVRFGGVNFTDDIILDQRPPALLGAEFPSSDKAGKREDARPRAARRHKVRISARDANSGVTAAQFAKSKRGKKGATVRFSASDKLGDRKLNRAVKVRSKFKPRFVRVQDAAGSYSGWKRIK